MAEIIKKYVLQVQVKIAMHDCAGIENDIITTTWRDCLLQQYIKK